MQQASDILFDLSAALSEKAEQMATSNARAGDANSHSDLLSRANRLQKALKPTGSRMTEASSGSKESGTEVVSPPAK